MTVRSDWAPYHDPWPGGVKEWWPAQAAPKQDFGTYPYGRLPERYRRHCRAQLRGLEMRAPVSCTCGGGLRITVPPEARYVPERARLRLIHKPGCRWYVA